MQAVEDQVPYESFDWEPMPNDNLERIDRAPYAVRSQAERPPRRQAAAKAEEVIHE